MKTTIKKLLCLVCAAVLILGTVPMSAFATSEWQESDFDTVLSRYYPDMFDLNDGYRNGYCENMMALLDFNTGRFTDLKYDDVIYDRVSTASEHYKRLARLLACYIMYNDPDGNYPSMGDGTLTNFADAENNNNPNIKTCVDVLNLLVDGWYEVIPPSVDENGEIPHYLSWWQDTIGMPNYMIYLIVMSEASPIGRVFGEEQTAKLVEYLCDEVDMKNYPSWLTGANLTWYARQGVIDGLVTHDLAKIKRSLKRMKEEIMILPDPSKEGIQADYSHHQHGNQYCASYGEQMVVDTMEVFSKFSGTELADKEYFDLMEERILDGLRWEKWGHERPLHLSARMISYETTGASTKKPVLATSVEQLIESYPESNRLGELQAFYDYLMASMNRAQPVKNEENTLAVKLSKFAATPPVVGNKYFWCSDYMVHNRPNYQVSELMVSERTEVAEQSNESNFKGQNIGFGSVYLFKENDNLTLCPVTWDWTKIPGTTMSDVLYTLPSGSQIWTQNSNFVGGVSDGTYGATAMVLSHRQTEAKKAMFFFDDEFVSLGSGITSAENNVATTLDQRFRLGELYVNGELKTEKGTTEYKNVSSVLQNNIAYVFPEKADITIKDETVTGRYKDIEGAYPGADVDITNDMFALWYDHGDQPRRQKYAYITIPEITKENLAAYEADIPVTIVSNTDDLQAVFHKDLNIGAAVFYTKGTVTLGDVTIVVNRPCIVMFTKTASGYKVSASNPKATEAKLNVSFKVSGKTKNIIFDLQGSPQGGPEMGGSTVTKSITV